MTFRLDEATESLRRTPALLDAWLRGRSQPWVACDEGPDTWSPFVVVGHLIHGEKTDWIPRARLLLEHGEARAFEPFDRFAQLRDTKGRELDELLDEFALLRAQSLTDLAAMKLTAHDLTRRGRHPDLGAVTLAQLLSTWVAHDLDYVQQIARVMARRYTQDCGPWTAYLKVLRS